MQLFKSQCLQEPGQPAHDFALRPHAFGPRYGRQVMSQRSFGLSTAALHGDDAVVGDERDARALGVCVHYRSAA